MKIITVSELTKEIKKLLENNFDSVTIIGEISNFKPHFSGHWYFSLKDADAQISCTMWKGINSAVFFTPKDGMKVIITGNLTVYPPRGNYQIDVRVMKPAGVGELQAQFEELKEKLKKEGLFDSVRKKTIPQMPMKIGIATAIDGAAFKDMISVARRRFPLVELIISPTRVQGAGAAESIVNSINLFNKFKDIELIIIGRGGGSIEDLWAFNEEIVARAIAASDIPIISAVGHEVDFTISDFVADLRAATPTAALELATPDKNEIESFIYSAIQNIDSLITVKLEDAKLKVKYFIQSYGSRVPSGLVNTNKQKVDHLSFRLNKSIDTFLNKQTNRLILQIKTLEKFDITNTLKKGFSLVIQNDRYIKSASLFNSELPFTLRFFDNEIKIN